MMVMFMIMIMIARVMVTMLMVMVMLMIMIMIMIANVIIIDRLIVACIIIKPVLRELSKSCKPSKPYL